MDNMYAVAAVWIGLALVASLISIRLGISVALIEIGMGVIGGNAFGLTTNAWIDFLAGFGAVLLTFLAGAEIDPAALRRHLRASVTIGALSFAIPAAAAFVFASVVAGWPRQSAEIAGLALSTTSVAVVYAVMIESGLASAEIGKLILAACFVTDLGTVLGLGVLFADFNGLAGGLRRGDRGRDPRGPADPALAGRRRPEPRLGAGGEVRLLRAPAPRRAVDQRAGSEAVLPAYLMGLAVAGVVRRTTACWSTGCGRPPSRSSRRSTSSRPALLRVAAGRRRRRRAHRAFLLVKVVAKAIGVWPVARAVRPAGPGRQLHDAADVDRADVRHDRGAVRADQPAHRPVDVHDPRHGRHPQRGRPDADRHDVLRAAHAGGEAIARRSRPPRRSTPGRCRIRTSR